jgi:hypothetical protein
MSKRLIKTISNQVGILSEGEKVAKVRFSMTQWQEFIDGTIPSLESAAGTIQFEKTGEAFSFFTSRGNALLRGGGIEARVNILSLDTFEVTGQITDIPKK